MPLPPGIDTKAAIKRTVKGLLAISPVRSLHDDTRILTYHSVGSRDHEMNVDPGDFADQMDWLRDHVEVISLDQAARGIPGVAITFDDGYLDNLTNAAPILCKHEIPATAFVVSGRLGMVLDHDNGDEDARLLSEGELIELHDAGIDIGGHTVTHRRLSSLDATSKRGEIVKCKQSLESILSEPVRAFAYPFGTFRDYDSESSEMVREAGYQYAVSNRYGFNLATADRYTLRRINIDRTDTRTTFSAKVDGRLDALSYLESDLGLYARSALNRVLHTE
jgi:peptidoglycan/xylan/chitin deacetylase (PgdA/CDA1 family)